jgi:BirA family biotin operon repressor/biotin-[acetyl-CoA-carboxylase] ligase
MPIFVMVQKYKCLTTCNAMISIGQQLTVLQSTDSTNNYAMARIRAGLAKHGEAFFALEQISGKGQRNKVWLTEPGVNIILSVVFQPPALFLSQQPAFNMAISLAVRDFFASYAGVATSIKWPNDIYWRDRKAGGILIENLIRGNETPAQNLFEDIQEAAANSRSWSWAVVGIGLNINQVAFPAGITNPVSLKQITGKNWDLMELVEQLCKHLQEKWDQLLAKQDLFEAYNSHLYKLNETVRLKKDSRVFEGKIKGVNTKGQLLVNTSLEETFDYGEIEWLLA